MASKCDYSGCAGYPTQMLDVCGAQGCSNMLHHLCQTEREFKDGIALGLMKRCASCYLTMYNERKGEEGERKSAESEEFQSAQSQPPRTPSPVIKVPTLPPIDNLLTLSPTATATVQDTTNSSPPKDM